MYKQKGKQDTSLQALRAISDSFYHLETNLKISRSNYEVALNLWAMLYEIFKGKDC